MCSWTYLEVTGQVAVLCLGWGWSAKYVADHIPPPPSPQPFWCGVMLCLTRHYHLLHDVISTTSIPPSWLGWRTCWSPVIAILFLDTSPPLFAEPYSIKLYSSSAFYVYSSLLDDLLLEVLRTELVVGGDDFYTSCGCCKRYSVLWNSLCVDTSSSSSETVTMVETIQSR